MQWHTLHRPFDLQGFTVSVLPFPHPPDYRSSADRGADIDPSDQSAPPAANPLGGDAIPAGKPATEPPLDSAQAVAALDYPNGGRRSARADAGPRRAPQPMAKPLGPRHHAPPCAARRQLFD